MKDRDEHTSATDGDHSLFYDVLQNAPFGGVVASTTPDGTMLYVNPEFTAMTGYDLPDVPTVGGWLEKAYPDPEYREMIIDNWPRDTDPANRGRDVVYRVTCKDGDVKDILLRAGHLDPGRMFVMMLDVTDRVTADRELVAAKDRYRNLVRFLPVGLVAHDANGILFVNPYAVELLGGQDPSDFFGRDVVEFVHPDWREEVVRRMARIVEHGENVERHEEKFIGLDGREVDVMVSGSPVDYGGRPAIQVVFADITRHKKAEEERRKLEARVAGTQKLESLSVLAGGIAHDFNNLLVGILGNADLALIEARNDDQQRHIEGISAAARQAADLARQLLAYSGRGRLSMDRLDVNNLIRDLSKLAEASVSKKVVFHYELADGLPPILADGTQVRQVVMNLVTNGAESLEQGAGEIRLTTGLDRFDRSSLDHTPIEQDLEPGEYVWIEVADTGQGMEEATLQRIFEPFFSTKFTGRGLGLAAALGIVRGHKGAVQVRTYQGEGTRFRVLFPACEDPGPLPESADDEERPPLTGTGTVLVVDDEESVRNVATAMLEKAGYQVLAAVDGEQALAVFRKHSDEVVCVVLDLTMPRLDGVETCRALQGIRADVPVILSSGYDENDAISAFRELGLAGFIQKPYRYDTLLNSVGKAVLGHD